jgi:hypothetical protein
MSSSDKHNHKTLSAKAEKINKLEKGENLLIWLNSTVLDVL